MRKVLAVILAATMAAGVATTAFAASVGDYDGYINGSIGSSGVGSYPNTDGVPNSPPKPSKGDSEAVWKAYSKALNQYKAAQTAYNATGPVTPENIINPTDVYNATVKEVVFANGDIGLPTAPDKGDSAATWRTYFTEYDAAAAAIRATGIITLTQPSNPRTQSSVAAVKADSALYGTYTELMRTYGFTLVAEDDDIFNWKYDGIGNLNVPLTSDSGTIEGEYYFDLEAAANNKAYSITDINKANNQPEDIIWVYGNGDNDDQSIFLITNADASKPEAHVRDGEISISMKTALKNTTLSAIGNFLGRDFGGTQVDAYTHTVPTLSSTTKLQTIQSPLNDYTRDGGNYVGTSVKITVPGGSNYVLENFIKDGNRANGGTYTAAAGGDTLNVEVYKSSVIKLPAASTIVVNDPATYFGDTAARGNLTLYEMVVTSQAKPNRDLDTSDYTVEVDYKTKVVKIKGKYGYSNKRDVESGERYVISESPRRKFEATGSVFNFNETINDEIRIDCQSYVDLYFKGNYGTDTENLRVVTDDIKEVEDFFGDYDIDYYDFVGQPKFAREVTCIIDGDSEAYIYEFDKNTGEMVDITDECTYESDGFKFKRREFKTYVMLEEPYDGGNVKTEKETVSSEPTSTVDPIKPNPGTGAYPEI